MAKAAAGGSSLTTTLRLPPSVVGTQELRTVLFTLVRATSSTPFPRPHSQLAGTRFLDQEAERPAWQGHSTLRARLTATGTSADAQPQADQQVSHPYPVLEAHSQVAGTRFLEQEAERPARQGHSTLRARLGYLIPL